MSDILDAIRRRAMVNGRFRMKESVVEITPPPLAPTTTTGSTTDGDNADRSDYESEMDTVSDSEDSSDDLDPLTLLAGSKASISVNKLTTKRSDIFEHNSNSSFKRLKLPPKPNAPFLKNNNVAVMLKKSEDLQKLHESDQTRAIDELQNEQNPKDFVLKHLSNSKASKDDEYVEFMSNNHDNYDHKDFFFLGKPTYVKPKNEPLPVELFLVPGAIRHDDDYEFDVFNELNIDTVARECTRIIQTPSPIENDISVSDITTFMKNIGGDITREKITSNDLSIDPKLTLQNIELVLMKFKYLVMKVVRCEYWIEKYELIIKTIGLLMMDRRVYGFDGEAYDILNEALNQVIKWKFKNGDTKRIELQSILKIWFGLTTETKLIIRILENLNDETSLVISRLRTLIALNIFSGSLNNEVDFMKNEYLFQHEIFNVIILKLTEWNSKPKSFFETMDKFYEPKLQFISLIQCLSTTYHETAQIQVDAIKTEIYGLRTKISTSFNSSEQASFKSLLLLISTLLENGEEQII